MSQEKLQTMSMRIFSGGVCGGRRGVLWDLRKKRTRGGRNRGEKVGRREKWLRK